MNLLWRTAADIVRVSGEQDEWYLQGQLSVAVTDIESSNAKLGLLLEPDGSLVAPVAVCHDQLGFELYCPRGSGEAVLERLMKFRLRTKVDFNQSSGDVLSLASTEPTELQQLIDSALSQQPGLVVLSSSEVGGWKVVNLYAGSDTTWVDNFGSFDSFWSAEGELARIVTGVPAWGKEIFPGMNPMELGRAYVRAHADFTKGCYTGQELIERVDSRGYNTPRRLESFAIIGDQDLELAEPIEVSDEQGKRVFTITSASRYPDFDCWIGIGFSHRYSGSFLDEFDFNNLKIVSRQPGGIVEYLHSK